MQWKDTSSQSSPPTRGDSGKRVESMSLVNEAGTAVMTFTEDTNGDFTTDSVKVYRATLTQASTAAPVATVGQNTLGQTVTPARTSTGLYTLTAGGAVFTANKTQIMMGSGSAGATFTALQAVRTSTTVITIDTLNFDTDAAAPADGLMTETAITIVVMP